MRRTSVKAASGLYAVLLGGMIWSAGAAPAATVSYGPTDTEESFTVPAGVISLRVVAIGAHGGAPGFPQSDGAGTPTAGGMGGCSEYQNCVGGGSNGSLGTGGAGGIYTGAKGGGGGGGAYGGGGGGAGGDPGTISGGGGAGGGGGGSSAFGPTATNTWVSTDRSIAPLAAITYQVAVTAPVTTAPATTAPKKCRKGRKLKRGKCVKKKRRK